MRAAKLAAMASPLQKLRVMHLYRHSLKNMLSWAVARNLFYVEVGGGIVAAPVRPGESWWCCHYTSYPLPTVV